VTMAGVTRHGRRLRQRCGSIKIRVILGEAQSISPVLCPSRFIRAYGTTHLTFGPVAILRSIILHSIKCYSTPISGKFSNFLPAAIHLTCRVCIEQAVAVLIYNKFCNRIVFHLFLHLKKLTRSPALKKVNLLILKCVKLRWTVHG
jgi:hypothetical protein